MKWKKTTTKKTSMQTHNIQIHNDSRYCSRTLFKFKQKTLELWQMLLYGFTLDNGLLRKQFNAHFGWCECRLCNLFNGFWPICGTFNELLPTENLCNSINKPTNIRKSWWCKSMCIGVHVYVCVSDYVWIYSKQWSSSRGSGDGGSSSTSVKQYTTTVIN